ncbi:hypothetical protein FISHEDRAFT_59061 [Fistulina hepatica ATCC 64428]|uniref:F-box domain-containing protein n=1 Tax=Fistulina hepatica ATCC 64428 TaxID=1128425 RepID=A0A0D7AC50_9AGAR|nr:hypothetical protein FISHEDRAFT_59061 [Fistulina hepatica ATCC 64428]
MSAKAAYELAHAHRFHLSTLPTELWMAILREATRINTIPSADNVLWQIGGTNGLARWAGSASHDALCRSMVTRRSIVLVCVAWNDIATPFLYEWIYVRRIRRLLALDAILSAEATVRRKPLAQYVRRLDVATRELLGERHFDAFIRIVRSLTHLEIFHAFVWHSSYFPSSCLSDLVRPSASTLKVFNLYVWGQSLAPSTPSGSVLQLTMPHLQRCMIHGHLPLQLGIASVTLTAPLLTTLEFPYGFYTNESPRSIVFEGIQNTAPLHLIVNFSPLMDTFLLGETFLATNGARLTSIEFVLDRNCCIARIIRFLRRECPRLATLMLAYYKWENAGVDLTTICVADPGMPESLETLGLRTQMFQSRASHFKKVASALEIMTAPRLQSVKLTEYRDIQHLIRYQKAQFLNLLCVVEARGWRLEDKIGNRLCSDMDIAWLECNHF